MDLHLEVETLLHIVKIIALEKAEERTTYGILLDTLLTVAGEGWINLDNIKDILQQGIGVHR